MKKAELGIGTYGLSHIKEKSIALDYIEGIKYALKNGVNLIDTYRSCGDTKERVGEIIKPIRHNVKVVSNFGSKDRKKDNFKAIVTSDCEDTLKKLSTDYIDFYQMNLDDPSYDVEEVIDALEQLKSSGKIIHYGMGHASEESMNAYIAKSNVSSLMVIYNAMDRKRAHDILNLCEENQIETMACKVTGQTLLTGLADRQSVSQEGTHMSREPLINKERLLSSQRIMNIFDAIGRHKGCTAEQIAIAWVLHDQRVNYALISLTSMKHMEEKLKSREIKLNEKELQYIHQVITEEEIRLEHFERSILKVK